MAVLSGENFDSMSQLEAVVNATNEDDDSGVDVWCEPSVETGVWVSLSREDQKEGPMRHLHGELLAGLGDFRELVRDLLICLRFVLLGMPRLVKQ